MKRVIPKRPVITPTLRMDTICTPRITLRKRASITRRSMAAKAKQAEPNQPDNPERPGVRRQRGARPCRFRGDRRAYSHTMSVMLDRQVKSPLRRQAFSTALDFQLAIVCALNK